MDQSYLSVNDNILQAMLKNVFIEGEKPILATKVEFIENSDDKFINGYILATFGSIYIFKSSMFGNIELTNRYSLMKCRKFELKANQITFVFEQTGLQIKAPEIIEISGAILSIYSECTLGVKDFRSMIIESDIQLPSYQVTIRPYDALRHRALFMAHYYDQNGKHIEAFDYFTKFEESGKNLLVIGPRFHPGNFVVPFGHAIAWDPNVNTVCFQSCTMSKISQLITSILQNSQHIQRIAFSDYSEKKSFNLELEQIEKTTVKRYWFMRSCGKVIYSMFYNSAMLPSPMDEIIIASCVLRPQEFGDIVTCFSESTSACGVRYLYLVRVTMKPFPFFDITRLLGFTASLISLTVRACLDIDATHLLKAVCTSHTKLRALCLTHVQFKTDVAFDLELPKSLLMFNLSYSSFSETTFKTMLEFLLYKDVDVPYILQACELVLKSEFIEILGQLEFNRIKPNFSEIDWSGNFIPKPSMRFFFALLFTQKNCRLLSFNEITSGDSTLFLSYLTQLMHLIPVKGLDLSGKFQTTVFLQFMNSLSDLQLKRLVLSCKNAGDNGMDGYKDLLMKMKSLVEVGADGFRPHTPQSFFDLWKQIAISDNILQCDVPHEDMFVLGINPARLGPELKDYFIMLDKKKRLTTLDERLNYMINSTKDYLNFIGNQHHDDFDLDAFKNDLASIQDRIFTEAKGCENEYEYDAQGINNSDKTHENVTENLEGDETDI